MASTQLSPGSQRHAHARLPYLAILASCMCLSVWAPSPTVHLAIVTTAPLAMLCRHVLRPEGVFRLMQPTWQPSQAIIASEPVAVQACTTT